MKKKFTWIAVLAVFIAVAKLFLHVALPSYTVHYKVTVEIETPEGIKSGSAVWELWAGTPLIQFPDSGNPASRKGESVVVDLGKRGVVFTLMSDQSWENGLYQAFPTEGPSSKSGIEYYKKNLKVGMKGTWNKSQPWMATFTDMNDPKSVRGVNPQKMSDAFGEGVRLKGITIEITDDPVTWGVVDRYLPNKLQELKNNWRELPYSEKERINGLIRFKQGSK